MGITDIDPIKFKLLFERFLNPERVQPARYRRRFLPEPARRGHRVRARKYGERAVSQIITFGTLGAKSVVRDVARVLGLELRRCRSDREDDPERSSDITLAGVDKKNKETGEMEHIPGAIDKNPELKKAVERSRRPSSSGNTRRSSKG